MNSVERMVMAALEEKEGKSWEEMKDACGMTDAWMSNLMKATNFPKKISEFHLPDGFLQEVERQKLLNTKTGKQANAIVDPISKTRSSFHCVNTKKDLVSIHLQDKKIGASFL